MDKNTATETAQNETMDFRPLFGGGNLKLETTPKAVPFSYESPNAIAPEQTLLAFVSAVVVGASRFANAGWLRHLKPKS